MTDSRGVSAAQHETRSFRRTPDRAGAALIPFARGSSGGTDDQLLQRLSETTIQLSQVVGHVVVVDDGSGLRFTAEDIPGCQQLIRLEHNIGKTGAIRAGLRELVGKAGIQYVVQCDCDLDQRPSDACLLVDAYRRVDANRASGPVLIVGDRYASYAAAFRSAAYRVELLLSCDLACRLAGLRMRDFVSGFRLFSIDFARRYLSMSQAEGFAVEIEQTICAYLCDATTGSVFLSWSRPRATTTQTWKVVEALEATSIHADALRAKGWQGRLLQAWAARVAAKAKKAKSPSVGLGLTGGV
ncbi:glycosyltransferase [Mycobacterium camsae]|uniref:glycosyltransferase n=1 Tax=Mycobacterium gordonae TaxID=1778 RepID=UPI00197D7477|nr:glycosyltransferase [Mycobacterium gordonae]